MYRANPSTFGAMAEENSPLLSPAGRVVAGPVVDRQVDAGDLSPVGRRPFLLRFLEPIRAGKHDKTGATPPATTNPDGQHEGNEDFGDTDYEP